MADHSNLTMFKQMFSVLVGENQTKFFTRLAEVAAPIIVDKYLATPIKRHLDGKITTPRTELAWIASNEAAARKDASMQLELTKQIAAKLEES